MKSKIAVGIAASAALSLFVLSGCNGSSNGNSASSSETGLLTIAVTDSPIDEASAVYLQFNGITLYDASGAETDIHFDEPKLINLLALQNGVSQEILSNYSIKAADYSYLAFDIDFNASYVVTPAGNIGLSLSNHRGALSTIIDFVVNDTSATAPISRFSVSQDQTTHLTVDFDLRKSIFQESGSSLLSFSPAVRSTITEQAGTISGSISPSQFSTLCSADNSAVYAYTGSVNTLRDITGATNDPISTANIVQTVNGYEYTLAFLPGGNYTIALACNAASDSVDNDDSINFKARTQLSVSAGQTSVSNL